MRLLLKLFLVLVLGSLTVPALLSEKIKYSTRPAIACLSRRGRISTVFNHVASIQSDSTWWQVFADKKKFALPVQGDTIPSLSKLPATDYRVKEAFGPRFMESIEKSWRLMRNSGVQRVMKETIQKVLTFCTLAASLLVIGSQKALAAAAPLVKNVKVSGTKDLNRSANISLFRRLNRK